MVFPDKILNEVIEEIAGADVVPLVQLIMNKSHVSEFKISEVLGITINHTRNMLYRLNEHSLVNSARKKDKKKGWYVYYWTLDMIELKNLAIRIKREKLNKIKNKLAREGGSTYFICPDKHIRISLEDAMECNFRCMECDQPLEKDNNIKTIENLHKMIKVLEEEIDALNKLEIKPVKERKLIRAPRKKKIRKKAKKIFKRRAIKRLKKKIKKVRKKAKKKLSGKLKRKKPIRRKKKRRI